MNRAVQNRLDQLVEERREQDAAVVREAVTEFLGGLTPEMLYACREPATLRPQLEAFLATQPARLLATIERWSAKKGRKGGQ